MRTLALVVLAAACGGGSKSPPPKTPEPAPAAEAKPAPEVGTTIKVDAKRPADAAPRAEAKAEPAPPPPPPPSALAVLDRVHDKEGDIPGMPGWKLKRVEDKTRCGATRIVITKGKAKLDADQAALAKVYAVEFPSGLNFDPKNKKQLDASMKKFNDFVVKLQSTGKDAMAHFEPAFQATDIGAKTAAAARVAQVTLQMASVLLRAPIPADVRSGDAATEKIDAYCEKLEEVSTPLAMRGQEALAACAKAGAPAGWYSALCAASE